MFSHFEANEKHYVRIKEIDDNSYLDTPNVTLKCYGHIYSRSRRSETGVSRETYSIIVKVYSSFLMGFVLNELSEGETIMIIGHSAMTKVKGGFTTRVTVAEQIYKSEWEKYFDYSNNGNGISWKDWS